VTTGPRRLSANKETEPRVPSRRPRKRLARSEAETAGRSAGNCYNAAPARWPRVVEVVTADMGSSCPAETLHANLLFLKCAWGTSAFPPGLDRMFMGPESVLELVLDVKQPNANRTCEKRDRQLHKQEWT
jgi:hypothetical protein